MDSKNNQPVWPDKEKYVDEKTREKIRKHIADPNDRITEEDIANVNTDIFNRQETEEEAKVHDRKLKENLPPKVGSAWDILH